MPIKKSELYSKIWASCDELRGGMDASLYKDYVLVLLFVKYVSDKYSGKENAMVVVPEGGSFEDMVKLKGKPDIGEKMDKIIAKLAEANDLKGVIDVASWNDSDKLGRGQAMVDRLSNLIAIFQDEALDFSKNRAEDDDLLGDAYEYLMRNFAQETGKSKGQFYTPAEVSRIMAKVIGAQNATRKDQTVFDPACGSGSLLLKVAAETPSGITIYGQEIDVATRALAVMNMWLHENPIADIRRENSIANPQFIDEAGNLKTFDFVVANPPFSTKSWSNGIDPNNDEFKRFDGFGVPPKKNGDYAFFLHILKSMKSTGKGAVILPHGVLFRGNVEAEIRKNIVIRGYIKGIIGLPANLFYGTGITACLIVFDKEGARNRKDIFMIDASGGYIKDGNKNRLRERDIHKIVDTFNKRLEISQYSRIVPISEIADKKNEYNLNIPRYIDSQEKEDIQDIEAHLKGGIPKIDLIDLNPYWSVFPKIREFLFVLDRDGYEKLTVEPSKIKKTILEHPQFQEYLINSMKEFEKWKSNNIPLLDKISEDTNPKKLIQVISEDILNIFSNIELIDNYEIYQHLMSYWIENMQDDVYLITSTGWKAEITIIKNKSGKEKGWDCELIPKELVINKYFIKQKERLNDLTTQVEDLIQQMQILVDENDGDDDLFSEARSDSGNITKVAILKRINDIRDESDFAEEYSVLYMYQSIMEKEKKIKNHIKKLEKELDKNLLQKYHHLTESDVKQLVIEDKWIKAIGARISDVFESISQNLSGRIRELSDRYEKPLPELLNEIKNNSTNVENHLKRMGYNW